MRFFDGTRPPARRAVPGQLTLRFCASLAALSILLVAAGDRTMYAASSISPRTVTLVPGATQKFSPGANGKVHWRATGGTITSSGVYTAGSTPGTFSVSVTKGNSTTTASVTIVAAGGTATPDTGATAPGEVAEPVTTPTAPDTTVPTTDTTSPVTVFPGDAVPIHPGESIQGAIDAHAAGTTFVIKAGTHVRQSFRPKAGMSFLGEPGAVLDGQNVTPRAVVGEDIDNVTIRGLRITRYVPPTVTGAVDAPDTLGWVVEHNEIDNNVNGTARSYGMRLGSQMLVRGNRIHHNGYVGIDGYKALDTVIEENEIYMNPPALREDSIGEAANLKCYACGRVIVRNNYFHDGPFRGIWFDRSAPDITIEDNRVINHGQPGIWYEVSYRGVIQRNYIENAGFNSYYSSGWLRGGGIVVTNSPDVSVLDNVVVNSLNGIIGLQAGSYYDGPYGKSELRNLLVRGNTIVMTRGQTGIAENVGSNAVYLSWNNRFEGNRYVLNAIERPFYWMGTSLDEWQWQANGQDVPATLSSFTR